MGLSESLRSSQEISGPKGLLEGCQGFSEGPQESLGAFLRLSRADREPSEALWGFQGPSEDSQGLSGTLWIFQGLSRGFRGD